VKRRRHRVAAGFSSIPRCHVVAPGAVSGRKRGRHKARDSRKSAFVALDDLRSELDRRLALAERIVELELDPSDGARLAWLYRHGKVLERSQCDGRIRLKVALLPPQHGQLARDFPPDAIL